MYRYQQHMQYSQKAICFKREKINYNELNTKKNETRNHYKKSSVLIKSTGFIYYTTYILFIKIHSSLFSAHHMNYTHPRINNIQILK